ncbi:unnamed protein product [Microthlaspi erraticum]|uniref:Integrase catalytic domain-containing protein n=2 Tax=Microthlaspi erraticum TaxID=1685480 RepID=A0A6D2IBC0_9BRAS|nr:unnamed protein product [Microthlaspi erraticum]CAA7032754.1 unnamed protein product [Microthlaspi erraticum]CAA7033377.1 unnamed protein product [Microthlaspi erraticum]
MTNNNPKYKTISPFDLSASDNPGAVISQPLLNGSNYDEWALNFRVALSSRKKFGFLDGSIPKPAPNSATPRANITQITTANTAAIGEPSTITESDREGLSGLTDDQWAAVQRLLNAGKSSPNMSGKNNVFWILDTGATHHMTGCLDLLEDIRDITPISVILPAGADTVTLKQGTVRLTSKLSLQNVYYVDGFHTNLISFGQLVTDNYLVGQVTDKLMILQDRTTRMLIGAGEREGEGLYRFRNMDNVTSLQTSVQDNLVLWHHRLGHPSLPVTGLIPGVCTSSTSNNSELLIKSCDTCFRAKQTRQCFPDSLNNAKESFDLIHCDLWGPYRTTAFCGSRYFLTIVDDHSRAVWLYLLPDKTLVSQQLRDFVAMIERQFSKKVKRIRSDNGTEFLCLTRFFQEKGILHETSCVYTPQQNGRVERKHRHILNIARALRFQAHLPIEYWGECVLTAGYLINRTPSILLKNKTPFEVLYGHPPGYKHLRVLGCLAYAHNIDHKGDKFTSRSRRCVFLGYPYGKKGWKLYDLEREVVFVSRDVVFQENIFPFADTDSIATPIAQRPEPPLFPVTAETDDDVVPLTPPEAEDDHIEEVTLPNIHTTPSPAVETHGRGQRTKRPSTRLHDYVVGAVTTKPLSPLSSPSPPPSSGSLYPLCNFVSIERFSPNHRKFLVALATNIEPRTFAEAMKHKHWEKAVDREIDYLIELQTWRLEELPPGKKALDCHWIFTIKYQSDGEIERHKARLVVNGNGQEEGFDYKETFAPVAKMTTVRVFLDLAAKLNHEVHQMDVHNAFLHGDLHEEVYMKLPQGFKSDGETRVCRLQKSLYGLKQASRCWFEKLSTALCAYGFKQTKPDYSLFTYVKGDVHLRILVYVDDLIISGSTSAAIQTFKDYLSTCFHMKNLGPVKYFLGIEVARNPTGIYLCQRKYATDIVEEMGLLGCRPASFPIDQNHKLALADGDFLADPETYRRLVGRLIYLAATRPDLTYSIHILSQFMHAPRVEHWFAALKVVRYIKGTLGQGILLRAESPLHLTGWCDSDYAACPLTRRSLTGYIVQLGDSPISWRTQKQDTVSRSSAEAEYRAMTEITSELRWLKALLLEFGIEHKEPMSLMCDSKPAIHLSANPVFHERTKHVEVDCHFVRDDIVAGLIKPIHVSTKDQLADILTKALGRKEFDTFLIKLGIHNLYAPT